MRRGSGTRDSTYPEGEFGRRADEGRKEKKDNDQF